MPKKISQCMGSVLTMPKVLLQIRIKYYQKPKSNRKTNLMISNAQNHIGSYWNAQSLIQCCPVVEACQGSYLGDDTITCSHPFFHVGLEPPYLQNTKIKSSRLPIFLLIQFGKNLQTQKRVNNTTHHLMERTMKYKNITRQKVHITLLVMVSLSEMPLALLPHTISNEG